jgi:hypothetical protein
MFVGKGFSLLMFGGTIWVLSSRRSAHREMCTIACLLLVLSTVVRFLSSWISIEQ